jgi:hypothetical protein
MKRRILLPLGLAALAMALALIAGAQLPQGALPVVLGVIAGVAASVPTSLIIVWRVTRGATRKAAAPPPPRPPTVMVVPSAPAAPTAASPAPRPLPEPRQEAPAYTIIGGQDDA